MDERFAMCSTFKWVLAAAVLDRVDRGVLSLDDRIPYSANDLLDHAPVTSARVAEGALPVDDLVRAAVVVSDNTATNLLLAKIGGPEMVTGYLRRCGDGVTRLDRVEPLLNENAPGDVRDTTTPRAMARLMVSILCGDMLSKDSRERLLGWLRACETGRERLRAGLPADWVVGDKTGSGANGACNDVAIVVPPGRKPVVIASYMSDGVVGVSALNEGHAEVARVVGRWALGQTSD